MVAVVIVFFLVDFFSFFVAPPPPSLGRAVALLPGSLLVSFTIHLLTYGQSKVESRFSSAFQPSRFSCSCFSFTFPFSGP